MCCIRVYVICIWCCIYIFISFVNLYSLKSQWRASIMIGYIMVSCGRHYRSSLVLTGGWRPTLMWVAPSLSPHIKAKRSKLCLLLSCPSLSLVSSSTLLLPLLLPSVILEPASSGFKGWLKTISCPGLLQEPDGDAQAASPMDWAASLWTFCSVPAILSLCCWLRMGAAAAEPLLLWPPCRMNSKLSCKQDEVLCPPRGFCQDNDHSSEAGTVHMCAMHVCDHSMFHVEVRGLWRCPSLFHVALFIYLSIFETGHLIEPKIHHFRWAGWKGSLWDPPTSTGLINLYDHDQLVTWVLGIRLRCPPLFGKRFPLSNLCCPWILQVQILYVKFSILPCQTE